MGKSGPQRLKGSKSLGDVGFLLFFRVVSGDYGKPRGGNSNIFVGIFTPKIGVA